MAVAVMELWDLGLQRQEPLIQAAVAAALATLARHPLLLAAPAL